MSKLLKSKILLGIFALALTVGVASFANAADGSITKTLKKGMRDVQVKYLQQTLNEKGYNVDGNGAGSAGLETTYFGNATLASVRTFQAANQLTADGIFGPLSRAALVVSPVVTSGLPAGCSSTSGFSSTSGASCATGVVNAYALGCTSTSGFSTTTGVSCAEIITVVVPSGSLSVALATNNPAAGTVLAGQALADLAHFTFSGTGTLSQVTLQRTGLSVSADVSNVYLFDGNTRLTDAASINTAGNVIFNNVNIAVAGTRTLSVKADMAATVSSVTLGMNLTGYMVTGSSTAIAVNIAGNLFTVHTAPSGMTTATLNADTVSSASVNAGSMNYAVWSNGLQVSGRAANLVGLNLHYVGSAPVDAVSNLKLYVDGVAVGSPVAVSANGYAMFDFGAAPVVLSVSTHTLEVRGDIVKGSNRNFAFSLQNSSDLMITDSQIGININAASAVANGVAGTISVNSGSVTVTIDPTFNTTTAVTGGATNVTIAKYKFSAYGEDMKITSLTVTPTVAGGTPATISLNNVALYANGGQIGSSANYVATPLVFTLGSSLIIPAGTTTIVEVRADTINATPANYTAGTLTVALSGSASNAQGMTSQNLITAGVPAAAVNSSALSIGAATATVAVSTSLNPMNVISNTAKTKIGSFVIQSGSTEGVRVNTLQVGLVFGAATTTYTSGTLTATGAQNITFNSTVNLAVGDVLTFASTGTAAIGTVTSITSSTVAVITVSTLGSATFSGVVTGQSGPMAITNVSNLYTSDDTSNVIGNPTATNNFSVNYTLAPSTSKTIDVYADLGALNGGTVQTTLKVTAVGSTTNVALTSGTGIATALNGQVMTVAAGSLATPTLTSASAAAQFVAGGTSPALATYNFVATNGNATITEVKFTVTTTATAIDHICIGTVCANVISGVADIAGLNILVPAGYAGKDVVVTPTFSAVGIGQQASNVKATMTLTYMKYTVGNTTTTNSSVSVSGQRQMTLVASYPSISLNTSTRSGLSNTLVKLADITVSADTHGAIKLRQLPIVTNSTGVATVVTGTSNVTVKDGSGNTLNTTYGITQSGFAVGAGGTSGSVSLVFGTPYNIPAGTSVTFGIYATAATVSGAVNTTSLSTKLGTNTDFLFDDVNGNVTSIPANDGTNTNVVNYPVDGSVITN